MNERYKVEQLFLNYQEIKASIRDIELQVECEHDIKGVSYDKVSTSPTNSISSSVKNTLAHLEYLKRKKKYLEFQIQRIENMLNTLSERDREIMSLYYFEERSLRDIAFKLDLNDNYISRRKTTILNNLVPFAKRYNLIN